MFFTVLNKTRIVVVLYSTWQQLWPLVVTSKNTPDVLLLNSRAVKWVLKETRGRHIDMQHLWKKERDRQRKRTAEICFKIWADASKIVRCGAPKKSLCFRRKGPTNKKGIMNIPTAPLICDDLNTRRREKTLLIITVSSYKSILMKWIKHRAGLAG